MHGGRARGGAVARHREQVLALAEGARLQVGHEGRQRRAGTARRQPAQGARGAFVLGDVVGRAIVADLLAFDPPAAAWESGMGSAFAAAGFWAFLPYAATARLFFYLNVRTRAEGWDVQTRFSAIAGRARGDDDTSTPSKEAA